MQIILTDQDNEDHYEETFEKWDEEMSSVSYRGECNDEVEGEEEEEENDIITSNKLATTTTKKDGKYTPLLNPDFNKPINIVAKEEEESNTTSVVSLRKDTPLAKLPVVENEVQPAAIIIHNSSPAAAVEQPQPLPKTLPEVPSPQQQQQHHQQPLAAQKVVTGLKRLLSIGSGNSKKNHPDLGISSASLHHQQQQQQQQAPAQQFSEDRDENKQYHVLRIFSGNINVGAMFNTVAVTPDMNADQLLKLALQKFHITLLEEKSNNANSARRFSSENGIEYYLTVKSMDGGKHFDIFLFVDRSTDLLKMSSFR